MIVYYPFDHAASLQLREHGITDRVIFAAGRIAGATRARRVGINLLTGHIALELDVDAVGAVADQLQARVESPARCTFVGCPNLSGGAPSGVCRDHERVADTRVREEMSRRLDPARQRALEVAGQRDSFGTPYTLFEVWRQLNAKAYELALIDRTGGLNDPTTVHGALRLFEVRSGARWVRWEVPSDEGPDWMLLRRDTGTPAWSWIWESDLKAGRDSWDDFEFDVGDLDARCQIIEPPHWSSTDRKCGKCGHAVPEDDDCPRCYPRDA